MLKIKALNQESSSDEDVPTVRREAQEEIALELYNKALRTQAQKDYDTSSNILVQLLQENIPQLENNGGLPKSMSTLKYSCYVNLGNIYLNQNNVNKALESFTNASELDSTDVTLWTKIGKLSLKEDKFNKAAYAFSKGLECSESHWPCLDNLISVLYAIKDTISCLVYIGKALMLDSEYTKGVVLKRQIYRDNPATKEYYQLYNPDHIWEPSIDIEISKEEEEEILKEAQRLCTRVTEVEKSLGSKPFDTIPLPKPLEEYTWLSLAKTVIYCHQYITDNNMSHFTFFDTSKCMSQSGESAEAVSSSKILEDVSIIKDNKSTEGKAIENTVEVTEAVGKMDTEPLIMERRFSQNSENTVGNDNQDNTPVQTDNDEEQNMELDNDNETEGDNQGDTTDTTQQRKKGKRKRDVLSDLQIWGWHSKRKQPKKSNRDFTVEDALNRIIPKSLLKAKITSELLNQGGEDSMNTMDIYNMYVENKELNFLSPIHSPKSVNFEAYFGTDHEKDDVLDFWTKERLMIDAVVLVKELVFELSKLWRYKWPKQLIPLYIELYKMFREHCDQPQPFCGDHTFEQIRDDALATLLYGELISFSSETVEAVHPTILSYLQIVSSWNEYWKEEHFIFFIRFYWVQSHCFRKTDENELAIRALEVILEEINNKETETSDRFTLSLSNCFKYGFLSKQIIEKIIKHLNMIIQMGNIENLFNSQKYSEVAEILKQTFHSGSYPKVGRMGRPAQLGILLHSLWFTDWEECFILTEECLYEAVSNYGKPNIDYAKWEKIIEKCLGIAQEIIKKETVCIIDRLTEEKRCRLVESLAKVVCKQLNTEGVSSIPLGSISPWILLHYVLLREEHRQYAHKRSKQSKMDRMEVVKDTTPETPEEELPPSIAILFSAHEFLGPKGWCLTGSGELLHFILDTVLDRLDTPIFEPLRDKIDIHIEQALFCLYLYPSKNNKISRHLVDHNVNPIPLIWERSFQLYQYYAPESLPEFNSFKSQSITADLKQLFKRIIDLVPATCSLDEHVVKIMDFVHGKTRELPECLDFPGRVRAIYYLLGDYYFKERQFAKCINYFLQDLCINPMRLDAWASLGLSYSAQLDNSLNLCEKLKNEADFFDKAKSAQVCFRKALELDPENLMLWIECGSFEYMVHSFCSRLIKYESENFSMEKFELLETEKESYLDSSGNSLEHAIGLYEINDSNEPDERWLQYYILGKIAEKKRKEPAEYLQYYMTANTLLSENKATYPDKINYNNPQHLSVEALELHYRIHASILKYMELHEGKDVTNTLGTFFKKCLHSTVKRFVLPPPTQPQASKTVDTSQALSSTSTSFQEQFLNSIKNTRNDVTESQEHESAEEIVKKCLEDLLNKVDEVVREKDCNEEVKPKEVAKNKEEDPALKTQNPDKSEDLDVTIIENEDVIMIISDSEDEAVNTNDQATEAPKEESPQEEKIENKESKMDVDEPVEDVQTLLDKMMEQTMKDTEKLDYSDPNNSGTEQIEEVVVKEDIIDLSKDEATEPKEVVKPQTNEKNNSDAAKSKPSDSETDTENKKATADEDSSSTSSSSSSDSSSSDSDSDDSDSSSSSSSTDSSNENMSRSETLQLVDKCIHGLEICITRLPQNYKALYRLAHLFFNYKDRQDYSKCKQLLLGEYKCKDDVTVAGLFSERNVKNFFNGIWRIPSTEIDRPGSLAAHMNRCLSLLLQILRNTNDTKTLMELYMQLKKVPDKDKIYIKDSDRIGFSEQAMDMCIQCFRGQIKNISNMSSQQVMKLLHDIFRAYQRVQKHISIKELTFASLLSDAYRNYIKEKIPDNINVLDLAIKFCQQQKASEKQKNLIQNPSVTFTSRVPGIANPPVHPTPSTLMPPQKPLKPPSMGRPRGRPPLPKLPGQMRQSRAKNPMATGAGIGSYPWQNPMYGANFNYEYLKHYQEELIKQYSQNLSLSQLQQLTNFFSTGQLKNPAVAQAVANQFLAQTGLLNPSSLLRPTTSSVGTGAIPAPTSSPFLDTGLLQKGINPQLYPALSNLTSEQMKFLETMLPNMSKQTSAAKPGSSGIKSNGSSSGLTSVHSSKISSNLKIHNTMPSVKPHQADYSKDKNTNLLMKERPNISITPVGNLNVLSTTNSSQLLPKSSHIATCLSSNSSFVKPSSSVTHTVSSFSITKQSSLLASGHSKSKPYISADVSSASSSKAKPVYVPTITSSAAFSKPTPMAIPQPANSVSTIQVPAAHSSVSSKSAHALPVTPPPVSSPSYMKPGLSTSPGKTLQEKLADKKKEQETKQMLKTIGAEMFVPKMPPNTTANILKGLNLPNIPSSLSVSPSTSVNPMVPYPMSLGMEKQPAFSKFPKSKNPAQSVGLSVEHKLPPNLTLSKSLPPPAPIYTPRFPADSGISISQIVASSIKDQAGPTERQSSRTACPISLDESVEISPVHLQAKGSSSSSKTMKDQSKRISTHTGGHFPGLSSSNSNLKAKHKPNISIKTDLFAKDSSSKEVSINVRSLEGMIHPKSGIEISSFSGNKATIEKARPGEVSKHYGLEKRSAKQSVSVKNIIKKHSDMISSEKQALSVIKNLSSIDITPLTATPKAKVENDDDEDVICLD